MGKGLNNKASSQHRRLKKHMQKNLGFETFSDRTKRILKTLKPTPIDLDIEPIKEKK